MTTTRHPARTAILATAIPGGLVVVAVLVAGLAITANAGWSAAEARVVSAVGAAHSPLLDAVGRLIDTVMGPAGAPILGVLLVAWALLLTGTWRGAARAGIVLAVPWAVAEAMKYVVRRPRPEPAALTRMIVPDPFTFSFPSGHTAFVTALVCGVLVCIATARARTAGVIVGGVVVLVVAWSRVYLGVHYPTDVVASMLVVVAIAVPLNVILTRVGPLRTSRAETAAARLSA